jgi:hypothetical protein
MQKRMYYLFLLFLLMGEVCTAQENTEKVKLFNLSSELFISSPYYFMKYKNQFNYGIGFGISENLKPFTITTGLFYTTKKYFKLFESTSSIEKITYSLDYFNIPIFFRFRPMKQRSEKNQILLTTGFIFNLPRNYLSTIYYKNNTTPTIGDSPVNYIAGSSFRIGFHFQRKLNDLFKIYTQVFGDYRFLLDQWDFDNSTPLGLPSHSEDRLLVGINIGIEWVYKKQ